eukprot:2646263-Rhodomonas_salina.1
MLPSEPKSDPVDTECTNRTQQSEARSCDRAGLDSDSCPCPCVSLSLCVLVFVCARGFVWPCPCVSVSVCARACACSRRWVQARRRTLR